ncbi:MAG: DUF349 domain-containing protein, partial [Pseudomonadales bacterium]|nr:DUF349 domain-containing protein [Pseudomonadales bacterium]
ENWKQVATIATPEQQHSVTNALSRSEVKVREYETKLETAEKELQESNAKQLERNGTLTTLEETINELEHLADLDAASPPALLGVIKSQESRWMEATRDTQVDKPEQKQYQLLMNQVKRYSTALEQYQAACPAMSSILSGAQNLSTTEQRKLDEHLKTINWPDALPTPDLIQQAEKALGRMSEIKQKKAQDAQTLKSQIEEQISELETALDSKVLKQTTRRYQELQKLLQSAPDKVSKAYQARFHLLGRQLGELRDWQGFATHPKQLELCTLMEALIDQHLEPQLKADKIKALQDEWKTLGGSSDQSLWNRFKAASDAAYEPCKAFFSEQKQLKRVNLEKRMTLCDQLQAFLDQNDWQQPDWKAVEKIERKAKEEWKESFPIDFKDNKPVQKRFNILIGALDEKLNQEKAQNLGKKQTICTQAEELIILEPMSEAIQQVKELQRQWTEIGITPYKEDRQLWKTFRTACDAIFARRDEQRKSAADKEQQNNAKAQQMIETVEVLVAELIRHPTDSDEIDPELQNTRQQLRQTETELNQLELNSRDQSKFKAQLKDLKHRVLELQSKLGARQRYEQLSTALQFSEAIIDSSLTEESVVNADSLLSRHQKLLLLAQGDIESLAEKSKNSLAELCVLVEILTGQDSPKEDQALRMQLQVQRLSEGFSGAQAEDTEDNLEAILDQWLIKVRAAPKDEITPTAKLLGQRVDQAIKHHYLNGQ